MTTAELGPSSTSRHLLNVAYQESRCEFLKVLRMPAYAVPTIAFPVMFYLLFGVLFGRQDGGAGMATYLLATYGSFGVIGAALFGFGVGLATERGQGWMLLKQASPMPIWSTFLAKMVMSGLFAMLIVAALFTVGITLGGVELAAPKLLLLASVLIVGTIPFCAFGLMLAYLCGPNSAPAVVNLIYLPMAFLSGLWMPIYILPDFVQTLAHVLPAYHLGQLALRTIGASVGEPIWTHVLYLAIFTAVASALAAALMKRDQGKTYG